MTERANGVRQAYRHPLPFPGSTNPPPLPGTAHTRSPSEGSAPSTACTPRPPVRRCGGRGRPSPDGRVAAPVCDETISNNANESSGRRLKRCRTATVPRRWRPGIEVGTWASMSLALGLKPLILLVPPTAGAVYRCGAQAALRSGSVKRGASRPHRLERRRARGYCGRRCKNELSLRCPGVRDMRFGRSSA